MDAAAQTIERSGRCDGCGYARFGLDADAAGNRRRLLITTRVAGDTPTDDRRR